MEESKIKEAFQKVKEDITSLKETLEKINNELQNIKRTIKQTDTQTDRPTSSSLAQTHPQTTPTNTQTQQTMHKIPENNLPLEASEKQNFDVSIGNRGVQTDRQTNQQTDRPTDNYEYNPNFTLPATPRPEKFALIQSLEDPVKRIGKVAELVNSLDALKKDLRRQFKKLTPQEMLVFSTIYQLTDQAIDVDYSILSGKTGLTESSIRDYVQKLLKKGVPLEKIRENNKRILLTIPPEFKRIASLDTIISLRDL